MESFLSSSLLLSAPFLTVTGAVGLTTFLWWDYRRRQNRPVYESKDGIPTVPGGLPIIGHALAFGSNPKKFVLENQAKYGSIFQADLMFDRFCFINHDYQRTYFALPEAEFSFTDVILKQLVPEYTSSVDAVTKPWHVPVIRSQFQLSKMQNFMGRIEEQVLNALRDHGVTTCAEAPVVLPTARPLAWEMIARVSVSLFLGEQFCSERSLVQVFCTYHQTCLKFIELSNLIPNKLLGLFAGKIKRQKDVVLSFLDPEVQRRRKILADNKGKDTAGLLPVDILTVLCESRRTAAEISERIMAFIFASMITTAGSTCNALHDLAGRGDALLQELVQEQDDIEAKLGTNEISHEVLEMSNKLHAFVLESMRHAALVIQQTRLVTKDNGVELAPGKVVKKDTVVAVSGIMINASLPSEAKSNEFLPSRFLDSDGNVVTNPEKTLGFFPFGIGRHYCPGRHLALTEIKGSLVVLLRNFHVTTVSGNSPQYTIKPSDVDRVPEAIRLTPRRR